MSLTKPDLTQIRTVFNEAFEALAVPSFDAIEELLDRVEKTQSEHSKTLHGHSVMLRGHSTTLREHGEQLRKLQDIATNIEGRLTALEADVKELYLMLAKHPNGLPDNLSKKDAEQKVVAMYQDILVIAKQLGVRLPSNT
jgi:hypothetical protein